MEQGLSCHQGKIGPGRRCGQEVDKCNDGEALPEVHKHSSERSLREKFFAQRKGLSVCHHILAIGWVQVGIILEARLLVKDLRATY